VDENEKDCDYVGPVSGLKLIPGSGCEPDYISNPAAVHRFWL